MFERKTDKLLPRPQFIRRVVMSLLVASAVIVVALGVGMLGYHGCAGLSWLDSLLNASMILTGMGPVSPLSTRSAKLFASAYALFSGVVFITAVGVMLSPIFHRVMHKFHLDDDGADNANPESRRRR